MKKIDCRNLNCPEPVIKTKNELGNIKAGETLEVLVDNAAAAENVARLAKSQNCKAVKTESGNDFTITITKEGAGSSCTFGSKEDSAGILFVKSAVIGGGDDELGRVLANSFFNTLADYESSLKKIFFVNGGVTLTTNGSDILESLKKLEGKGVEIFSCGTCLDFYGLKEELGVGKVGNMYDIVDNLFSHKVVYI
jgi:selenium metabolism protein YedF